MELKNAFDVWLSSHMWTRKSTTTSLKPSIMPAWYSTNNWSLTLTSAPVILASELLDPRQNTPESCAMTSSHIAY
ncbi:unnamed protein product [Hymenolepis diminuta]|uniref:Uncharacterized protein n=1 Tax=Hymenolepis diminuta TaxID=6216 RepID=A0A564YFS1_HYMDI|nr:unnamed protein product [Hymenolepis diminuta]